MSSKLAKTGIFAEKNLSNTYFQFKQFRIEQDRCAMKVCTDACVQGALAVDEWSQQETNGKKILDVGTGTGLLTLMLAQAFRKAEFQAIEINPAAAQQAQENFDHAPFSTHIQLESGDFRNNDYQGVFDLIISNPPFYEEALKSPDENRNQAMHASHLSFQELLEGVKKRLKKEGVFCVMIPSDLEKKFLEQAAALGLYPFKTWKLRHSKRKPPFRSVLFLSTRKTEIRREELVIYENRNEYTLRFKKLLSPYYLKL